MRASEPEACGARMSDAARTEEQLKARLRETMGGGAQEPQIGPTASMLYELLLAVHTAQVGYGSERGRVRMKHRIEHASGSQRLAVEISNVNVFGTRELDAMRRFARDNFCSAQFQFRSPKTGERLTYGRVLLRVFARGALRDESGEAAAARLAAQRAALLPYAAPDTRRPQTMPIDWRESIVARADQPLVLELIDDVYNMHALMPASMSVSLEPIERTDHQSTGKRKQLAADAESTDRSVAPQDCVGYALHFGNVPSFSDAFLVHLAHKFGARWLGAVVLFPSQRRFKRAGTITTPAELIVSLRAEAAGPHTKSFALRGAKRACRKVEAVAKS